MTNKSKTPERWLIRVKHPSNADLYMATWVNKATGEVIAVAPQFFADQGRAFDYVMGLARQGFRDPRTMRKWPKWLDVEAIGAVVPPKTESFACPVAGDKIAERVSAGR